MLRHGSAVLTHSSEIRQRDRFYEDVWLERLIEEAAKRHGIPAEVFTRRVRERAALGAERYGDTDFFDKDVVGEGLDETPDVAWYALMEAQKRVAHGQDIDGEKMNHLFEAAVAAAKADWHFRRAR